MTNEEGRYGEFGGQFVPETLMKAVIELNEAYTKYMKDPEFLRELDEMNRKYTGRPSLLYYAERMTEEEIAGNIVLTVTIEINKLVSVESEYEI